MLYKEFKEKISPVFKINNITYRRKIPNFYLRREKSKMTIYCKNLDFQSYNVYFYEKCIIW